MATKLTDEQKEKLALQIREFLAEECDMDVADVKDDTDIMEDLKADSLVFLELIQEIQEDYEMELELRQIGKYIVKNPVKTVGQAIETMFNLVERGDDLLNELE